LAGAVNKALPDHDLVFSVSLCPEELIADTTLHGHMGVTVRFIQAQMSISDEWLGILLKGDAFWFDPFQPAPGSNLDLGINGRLIGIGRLGMFIVKKPADTACVDYDGADHLIVLPSTCIIRLEIKLFRKHKGRLQPPVAYSSIKSGRSCSSAF
jgi:hypothetical protein